MAHIDITVVNFPNAAIEVIPMVAAIDKLVVDEVDNFGKFGDFVAIKALVDEFGELVVVENGFINSHGSVGQVDIWVVGDIDKKVLNGVVGVVIDNIESVVIEKDGVESGWNGDGSIGKLIFTSLFALVTLANEAHPTGRNMEALSIASVVTLEVVAKSVVRLKNEAVVTFFELPELVALKVIMGEMV